jgi:LacI family transcriptional regulator
MKPLRDMSAKKARIIDIAQLAGVSIGTVDRVLHERGEVAEKTRKKILGIARDLDYSPNLMARALRSKKRYHLVSLLPVPDDENTFWDKHPQGLARAMDELDPFPFYLSQITFDLLNERDFQEKAKSVIKLHPDAVILAPIFKSESIAFCSGLSGEHIPFVFVDGYIDETDFLAYIGEDVFQSGRVAGQLTDMVTPAEKDILIINIARNLQNVHNLSNRTKGFLSYFPESGRNRGKKIKLNISATDLKIVKTSLDKVFREYPGIASVFISGSKSYRIASYLESSGLKSVNLIGYDLLERNIEYLKSGIIKFLICQRPDEQTYKAVKKLFEFLSLNKIPEKMEYLPIDIVTSENVNFIL